MKNETDPTIIAEIENYNEVLKLDKANMPLEFNLSGEHVEYIRTDWLCDFEENLMPYWEWVLLKVEERIEYYKDVEVNFQKDCKNGLYAEHVDVAN
jgi:hypothetical protein